MSINQIAKILDLRSIPYFTENDRIYADSMIVGTEIFENVEDVTNWTPQALSEWLGY